MREPKSTNPWVVNYRNQYHSDPIFREKEKARVRARYVKKVKQTNLIDEKSGKECIPLKEYVKITGLNRGLVYRLLNDNIIPCKRHPTNKGYYFLPEDAYLMRDFLPNFLIHPHVTTFEKYDIVKLKDFLRKNSGLYDYQKGTLNTH